MRKDKFTPYFIVLALLVATSFLLGKADSEKINSVTLGGEKIKVEIVRTPSEREQGLSGRMSLSQDAGMLFIFEQPGKYYFWMKDMNFPIDIIWLGEDMKVVHIEPNVDPAKYPEAYGGEVDAKYVLEVNAGFSEKNNLKVGEQAESSF